MPALYDSKMADACFRFKWRWLTVCRRLQVWHSLGTIKRKCSSVGWVDRPGIPVAGVFTGFGILVGVGVGGDATIATGLGSPNVLIVPSHTQLLYM
jgi:hypothetical protein